MTDRELLEMAAKAAGYRLDGLFQAKNPDDMLLLNERGGHSVWNPLAYDGDALRLAVKLGVEIHHAWDDGEIVVGAWFPETSGKPQRFEIERINDDPYAATRRAIVRAAAAIGETK